MFHSRPLLASLALVGSTVASLAEGVWKPLWDGKTLAGWHIIGKGEWKVEDGAIVGLRRTPKFGPGVKL